MITAIALIQYLFPVLLLIFVWKCVLQSIEMEPIMESNEEVAPFKEDEDQPTTVSRVQVGLSNTEQAVPSIKEQEADSSNKDQTELTHEDKTDLTDKDKTELTNEDKTGLTNEDKGNPSNTKQAALSNEDKSDPPNTKPANLFNKDKVDLTNKDKTDLNEDKANLTNEDETDLTNEDKTDLTNEDKTDLTNEDKTDLTNEDKSNLTSKDIPTGSENCGLSHIPTLDTNSDVTNIGDEDFIVFETVDAFTETVTSNLGNTNDDITSPLTMSKLYNINDAVFVEREERSEHDSDELLEYELYKVDKGEGFWSVDTDDDLTTELEISIQIVPTGMIINSNVFLTELQWNTITLMDGNLYNCAVCNVVCDKRDVEPHVRSDGHNTSMEKQRPLKRFDLSIVRKIKNLLHCAICNETFHFTEFSDHENTKTHEGNLLAAINRVSDLMYDSELQAKNYEFNILGERNIFGERFHSFSNSPSSELNSQDSSRNSPFLERHAQRSVERSGLTFQTTGLNVQTSGLNVQTTGLNVQTYDRSVGRNFEPFSTKNNNDLCHFNANAIKNVSVYDDFSDDEDGYEYTTPCEGVSYASMAKKPRVELPKNLKIDLGTKEVRVKFESWHMLITPERNKFYCMVCNKLDMIRNKSKHVATDEHRKRLDACSILAAYDNYLIRMVSDKLYHCGHCNNLQYNHQMEQHIESLHPRKSKIIIDTTSSTASPVHKSECDKVKIESPIRKNENATGVLGEITISPFGSDLKISALSYNIIIEKDGYYCAVCDAVCVDVKAHVEEPLHVDLISMTLFIRIFKSHLTRAVKGTLHCGLCNELIPVGDIYIHNVAPWHTNALATALGMKKAQNPGNTNVATVAIKKIDNDDTKKLAIENNLATGLSKNIGTCNTDNLASNNANKSFGNLAEATVDIKDFPKLPKPKKVEPLKEDFNKTSNNKDNDKATSVNEQFTAALKNALKIASSKHSPDKNTPLHSPHEVPTPETRSSTPRNGAETPSTTSDSVNFKMPQNKNEPLKNVVPAAGVPQKKKTTLWGSNLPQKLTHAEYLLHKSQSAQQLGQNTPQPGKALLPTPNSLLPTPNTLSTPNSLLPTPNPLLPTPNTFSAPNSLLPTPSSLLPTPNSLLPTPNSFLPNPNPLFPQNTRLPGQSNVFPGPNMFNFGQMHGQNQLRGQNQFNPGNYANFGQNASFPGQGNPLFYNPNTPRANFNSFPHQGNSAHPNFNTPINYPFQQTPVQNNANLGAQFNPMNAKTVQNNHILKIGNTEAKSESNTEKSKEDAVKTVDGTVKDDSEAQSSNDTKNFPAEDKEKNLNDYFKDYSSHKDIREELSEEGEVVFNEDDFVFLTLKTSYFKVTNIFYHTLVYVDTGIRHCFVCSMTVKFDKYHQHIESRDHLNNLKKTKFIEKYGGQLFRQMYITYHCAVCNIIMSGKEIKTHVDWPIHIESYQNSLNVINKRTRKEIKSGVITVHAVETQKEAIYHNVNDPYVKVGYNEFISNAIPIKDSKIVQRNVKCTPKKKSKLVIYKNTVLKIAFDNWHGIAMFKNFKKCIICQVELKMEHVLAHLDVDCHTNALGLPFESQYYPALIRKVGNNIVNCIFCNIELSNNDNIIYVHIGGKKHKKIYEDILKDSANPDAYTDCYEEVINL